MLSFLTLKRLKEKFVTFNLKNNCIKCKTAYLRSSRCTGAADKLHAAEHINTAGQEHGKAAQLHGAVAAGRLRSPVPLVKVPAAGLVVDVVEQTVLGHEQRVRLERPLKTSSEEKFD